MITVHHAGSENPESIAARKLQEIAGNHSNELQTSNDVFLEIIPSVQCFGQKVQDIDLLVLFADYRNDDHLMSSSNGKQIHSFCLALEVKGHSPEDVMFQGANCSVNYRGAIHNVTLQSQGQVHSLKKYIEISTNKNSPYVSNIIWLTRVPQNLLPPIQSNVIGGDATWQNIIDMVASLSGKSNSIPLQTFSHRQYFFKIKDVFSKKLHASKIDRRKFEAITKVKLKDQQYLEKFGQQILVIKGLGGTGKTVQLLGIAHKTYSEYGYRVLILTYNKALVSDIKRLLSLYGIKDAIAERSISIRTIYSFLNDWLVTLGVLSHNNKDYFKNYENYKEDALSFLRAGAIARDDIKSAISKKSRDLMWDLILIDESQDWPKNERDLLFSLYGYKNFVIADGVNQFVRGTSRVNWIEGIEKADRQFINITKSLRLKSTLCEIVGHFARQIGVEDWNLEPEIETHGGKFIVIEGNAFDRNFHSRIVATAKTDGNHEVDILMCVPPSWVSKRDGKVVSRLSDKYIEWNLNFWDGVDLDVRSSFPTSLDQYRIVQYESCRGLEGWVVVNFAFDEFYEYKLQNAEIDKSDAGLFFEEEKAVEDYAKKWLMIPMTRAIDTLILHISDCSSHVGKALKELKNKFPEDVQWISYNSSDEKLG